MAEVILDDDWQGSGESKELLFKCNDLSWPGCSQAGPQHILLARKSIPLVPWSILLPCLISSYKCQYTFCCNVPHCTSDSCYYTYCGISVALPPTQNPLNFCPLIAALQKCLCHMHAVFKGSPLKHLCIYNPVQFKLLERLWHLHKTWCFTAKLINLINNCHLE